MPKRRAQVLAITVEYTCPNLDEGADPIKRAFRQNDGDLHAESESCSHCGFSEAVSFHIRDCAGCGREHLLWLMSRQNG